MVEPERGRVASRAATSGSGRRMNDAGFGSDVQADRATVPAMLMPVAARKPAAGEVCAHGVAVRIGTTSGVPEAGSSMIIASTSNTSLTSCVVMTSAGVPVATTWPSRIAIRWSA